MAYKAYLNNKELFFDSSLGDDSFLLSTAKVSLAAGAAGSFTFTVPPSNDYYDQFHQIKDYIDVFRDDDRRFSGRVYSITKQFDTQLLIRCEGLLAILNDTIFRPVTFNGYLHDLVNAIISSHNSQIEEEKFILIDELTIPDAAVYRDYMNYETSISRLQDLADTFGGFMQLDKDYDESYIAIADIAIADLAIADKETGIMLKFSWLEDFTTGCDQKIVLGYNLLDIQKELNSNDVVTVLIPLGAEDEDGNRLTIESVNNGLDYLTASSTYINQYGYVTGVKIWEDVTTAATLKTKGEQWLASHLAMKVTINLSAVDLADAGYDVESFKIGQKVTVDSEPHDLDDDQFNCVNQELDLLDPMQNKLTIGVTQIGYVQAQRVNSSEAVIQKMSQTFVSKTALQTAVDQATNRIIGNDGGYVVFHDSDNDGEPDEILVMDTPDISTAVKVWRWNKNGLGYSSTGYSGTYGLAMTIDGQIVATFITTGELNGALLKALSVAAGAIAANAVTAEKIAAGAVITDKLAALAVTSAKIAALAVTAEKIAAGAITTDKLAANAVTAAKIDVADLFAQAITASNLTITGGKLQIETTANDSIIDLYHNLNGSGVGLETIISPNAVVKKGFSSGSEMARSTMNSSGFTAHNYLNNTESSMDASAVKTPKLTINSGDLVKIVEKNVSITVGAQTYFESSVPISADNGYEIIGLAGYYFTPGMWIRPYRLNISTDKSTFYYRIYSEGTTQLTTTLYFYLAEAKTK